MKLPRKLKKAIKRCVIAYDIQSKPSGIRFEELITGYQHTGFIIYDSKLGGDAPKVLSPKNKRIKIKSI